MPGVGKKAKVSHTKTLLRDKVTHHARNIALCLFTLASSLLFVALAFMLGFGARQDACKDKFWDTEGEEQVKLQALTECIKTPDSCALDKFGVPTTGLLAPRRIPITTTAADVVLSGLRRLEGVAYGARELSMIMQSPADRFPTLLDWLFDNFITSAFEFPTLDNAQSVDLVKKLRCVKIYEQSAGVGCFANNAETYFLGVLFLYNAILVYVFALFFFVFRNYARTKVIERIENKCNRCKMKFYWDPQGGEAQFAFCTCDCKAKGKGGDHAWDTCQCTCEFDATTGLEMCELCMAEWGKAKGGFVTAE